MAQRLLRLARWGGLAIGAGTLVAGGTLTLVVWSREPLSAVASTRHESLGRQSCLQCHAPIADEWRASLHARSLGAQPWRDVREMGYLKIFNALRKRCVDCHAPANVLDLGDAPTNSIGRLGVECTPNLFREPPGVVPRARLDEPELGVDCTSCHVSQHGIAGTGRLPTDAHLTAADVRFQNRALASQSLCRVCHGSIVASWASSPFRGDGVSCLDCHMPAIESPAVVAGPVRLRRSHRFPGDKDDAMLQRAVQASLDIGSDRVARFELANKNVGHDFPSGGNFVSVRLSAIDPAGTALATSVAAFGREEGLIFDFWPFAADTRIPPGERRRLDLALPPGHGRVEAIVTYHDWIKIKRPIATINRAY